MFRALSRLLCRQDKQKRPIASWTHRPPPPHPPSQPPRLRPLRPRLSSSSTPQLLIFIAHHLIALCPAPLSRHNLIPATIATFAPMPPLYPSQNIRRYTSTARAASLPTQYQMATPLETIRQTSMKPEGVSKHRKNIAHAHAHYPAEKRLQHHSHSMPCKRNQERDYLEKGHSLGSTQKE